ncbi:hypothetical protein FA13DRAFT_1715932 [Coprinellus micaceus]|uniref:Uncharacterized protein n=1 Tax=Coprinellus micaceus TaxID=71717 RepID=A0A4Y7SLM5_COPMI|nr:hypothetical protein FA13DRAFT_1715932 [Coprinellus micaceus]
MALRLAQVLFVWADTDYTKAPQVCPDLFASKRPHPSFSGKKAIFTASWPIQSTVYASQIQIWAGSRVGSQDQPCHNSLTHRGSLRRSPGTAAAFPFDVGSLPLAREIVRLSGAGGLTADGGTTTVAPQKAPLQFPSHMAPFNRLSASPAVSPTVVFRNPWAYPSEADSRDTDEQRQSVCLPDVRVPPRFRIVASPSSFNSESPPTSLSLPPLAVKKHVRAFPHEEGSTVWYESSSDSPLAGPPLAISGEEGELFLHRVLGGQSQLWLFAGSQWGKVKEGVPHPTNPGRVLHIRPSGQPSWNRKAGAHKQQSGNQKGGVQFRSVQVTF